MAGIFRVGDSLTRFRPGAKIAFLAILLWIASLPFSMAQQIRFTSIFLFSILGGFLIHILSEGFQAFRVSVSQLKKILPVALFAVLPFYHFVVNGDNERELVLGLPLLLIPFIIMYLKESFSTSFVPSVLLVFFLSWFLLLLSFLFRGPEEVWNYVRSNEEIPDYFLLGRPQMGLLTGLVFFMALQAVQFRRRPVMAVIMFVSAAGVLFWILAKIAFIGLVCAGFLVWIISIREKPLIFWLLVFACLLLLISGVYQLNRLGIIQELVSNQSLPFEKYPKVYVNSINSRIILWKASLDVLARNSNWLAGLPSSQLRDAMDNSIAVYSTYFSGKNFNSHNQLLYVLLHYGMAGLVVFGAFWISIFRLCRRHPALTGLWFFFFICSLTEIYIDREFGSQVLMLMLVLSIMLTDNERLTHRPFHE